MTSPALNGLFVVHLERARGPGLQVDEADGVEADPAFPADVVGAHASEDDDEPVLVEDGGVVAAGGEDVELSHPGLAVEGVHLGQTIGETAVSADDDRVVLVDGATMALPRLRPPAL